MNALIKTALLAATLATSLPTMATPIQLITNGNFESGSLSGWTVVTQNTSGNNFYAVQNGAAGPVSGYVTASNPSGGAWPALSDQFGPGGEALSQTFVKTSGMSSLLLTFDWFNNVHTSYTGSAIDGSSEAGRVDIMKAGASSFDVGSGVAENLLLNAGSANMGDVSIPWQHATFDLSALAPGSYTLRFGNGQCCSYQEMGVDNVSLVAQVPEPAPLSLGLAGFAVMAWQRRRRNGKAGQA